jgi:hypothetical protein
MTCITGATHGNRRATPLYNRVRQMIATIPQDEGDWHRSGKEFIGFGGKRSATEKRYLFVSEVSLRVTVLFKKKSFHAGARISAGAQTGKGRVRFQNRKALHPSPFARFLRF